ncbi:MAG: glutaredoxin family protein [Candidatus Liptonbacteria bacterium]|nr:glutaredoxin family protein [Candidatus Liptonbacteria bacterium]
MPKITIYSAPWCVYCKMVKAYLEEKKIAFTEHDVSADDTAKDDMIKKSGQMAIPVVEIDGKIIIGFDKTAINKALGL